MSRPRPDKSVEPDARARAQLTSNVSRRRRVTFAAATSALALPFVASGAAIPQFERYRALRGLTLLDISIAATGYSIAVMITLVLLGRVSDHIGRRTVTIIALSAAAAGCVLLLDVTGLGVLTGGRMLQGLACALASSAVGAYVLDVGPRARAWIAPAVATGAPLAGLAVGSLVAGGLVEFGPRPQQTPYLVVIALLVMVLALVLVSSEPVRRNGLALHALRPRIAVPRTVRSLLPTALPVFCATWAMGGFYLSFSPSLALQSFGTSNAVVAAVIFASYMALFPAGSLMAGRVTPFVAQRAGIICFAIGVVGVAAGLLLGSMAPVLFFGMAAGAGQGLATTGAMAALVAATPPADRTGLLSAIYLVSYSGATLPNLIAGALARFVSLADIAAGYAVLAVIALLIVLRSGVARDPDNAALSPTDAHGRHGR